MEGILLIIPVVLLTALIPITIAITVLMLKSLLKYIGG